MEANMARQRKPSADCKSKAKSRNVLDGQPHRVEWVPINALTPCKGNARTHSQKQIRQIADSVEQFGFTNPLLIDGGGEIIAGHGRLEAARLLGQKEVPALRLSHLSPAQKRAYRIADNKLAENATWNRKILAAEFEALIDLDFDIEQTGFDLGEVDLILDQVDHSRGEAVDDEDDGAVTRANQIVSQRGDLWRLGQHRLLCGDIRNFDAHDLLLDGEAAAFVFTGLPNGVASDGNAATTIMIAAERAGCGARGIEIDPQQVDAAIRRWQAHTGKPAILAGTERSFAQIEDERARCGSPPLEVGRMTGAGEGEVR
jgi:ParB-like chromosome segregation protein Spo0J